MVLFPLPRVDNPSTSEQRITAYFCVRYLIHAYWCLFLCRVKMRETFYGPGHALVAPSLEKQALLELTAGREVEAAELLKKCLLMQEERCVILLVGRGRVSILAVSK